MAQKGETINEPWSTGSAPAASLHIASAKGAAFLSLSSGGQAVLGAVINQMSHLFARSRLPPERVMLI